MSGTADRFWPRGARLPWLRLAAALVAAPLVVTLAMSGLTFLVAAVTETSMVAVMAVTRVYGEQFLITSALLTLGGILPAVAALWALGRRGRIAWAVAGAAAGAIVGVALSLADGRPFETAAIVSAVLGLALAVITRWLAGIRRR